MMITRRMTRTILMTTGGIQVIVSWKEGFGKEQRNKKPRQVEDCCCIAQQGRFGLDLYPVPRQQRKKASNVRSDFHPRFQRVLLVGNDDEPFAFLGHGRC